MPTYEYVCMECQEKAEVRATISDKERGLKVICPRCGSNKMVQVFGSFAVMAGSKSGFNAGSMTGCGPNAGPGCCPSS